jgi:hypothetical protein
MMNPSGPTRHLASSNRAQTAGRAARRIATAVMLSCMLASPALAQQQFEVFASIVNAIGASVATLQPTDVRVMENGVEASITRIESVSFPVKLQLLLDNGVGLGSENLVHLRNGVQGLLDTLPDGMEVTMVVTGGQPRVLVRATTDRAAMVKGLGLLAPDGGAGRFVESMTDAAERIEKDKGNYVAVIVSVGTTAGDLNVKEQDVERLVRRLQTHPTIVHVVLLSLLGSRSARGGGNQIEVGAGVSELTGGRFETIAAPSRLVSLLPEIGAQVASTHERQRHQFKITVRRPAAATGELKNVTMAAFGGLVVSSVSFDGRVTN